MSRPAPVGPVSIVGLVIVGLLLPGCGPSKRYTGPDRSARELARVGNVGPFVIVWIDGVQATERSVVQDYQILPGRHVLTVLVVGTSSQDIGRGGAVAAIPVRSWSGCHIVADFKSDEQYWVRGDLKMLGSTFNPNDWDAWLAEGDRDSGRRAAECIHFPRGSRLQTMEALLAQ